MPPPADIVKVAIEWPGAFPKLMEIDQVGAWAQKKKKASQMFCLALYTLKVIQMRGGMCVCLGRMWSGYDIYLDFSNYNT